MTFPSLTSGWTTQAGTATANGAAGTAIYRDLAMVDVPNEYEEAMKSFPVK